MWLHPYGILEKAKPQGWGEGVAGNTPERPPALGAPTAALSLPIGDANPSPGAHRDVQRVWRGELGVSAGASAHIPVHIGV
mgnify:CR=1 FL=1